MRAIHALHDKNSHIPRQKDYIPSGNKKSELIWS